MVTGIMAQRCVSLVVEAPEKARLKSVEEFVLHQGRSA
jgi:hypothetical protein